MTEPEAGPPPSGLAALGLALTAGLAGALLRPAVQALVHSLGTHPFGYPTNYVYGAVLGALAGGLLLVVTRLELSKPLVLLIAWVGAWGCWSFVGVILGLLGGEGLGVAVWGTLRGLFLDPLTEMHPVLYLGSTILFPLPLAVGLSLGVYAILREGSLAKRAAASAGITAALGLVSVTLSDLAHLALASEEIIPWWRITQGNIGAEQAVLGLLFAALIPLSHEFAQRFVIGESRSADPPPG